MGLTRAAEANPTETARARLRRRHFLQLMMSRCTPSTAFTLRRLVEAIERMPLAIPGVNYGRLCNALFRDVVSDRSTRGCRASEPATVF